MLLLILIFLVVIFSATNAKCVYRRSISKNLKFNEFPSEGDSTELFGLYAVDKNPPFITESQCESYCNSQPWCFGTSESVVGFCQFHTDFAALGFYKPDHYDCRHNINANCEFESNYLIDIGGRTFGFLSFDKYGSRPKDVILPDDVVASGIEGFCLGTKSVRNENGHPSNSSFVYTRYYGTAPVTPFAWSFHFYEEDEDRTFETTGNQGVFASNGVNRAHRGFPIKSIQYWDININQDTKFPFSEASRFTYLRNEHIQNHKCADSSTDTHYVDRQALKAEKTFFHIKMHDELFLSCNTDGCTWQAEPTIVWSYAPFKYTQTPDLRFGADNIIIGHDPTTKEELGWLAADMDEDVPDGTIRLMAKDNLKDDEGKLKRGLVSWGLFIAPSVVDKDTTFPPEPMHGTSLCYTAKYIDVRDTKFALMCVHQAGQTNVAKASQVNADLTLDSTIVPDREAALLNHNQTGFNYNRNYLLNDGTAQGGDNITAVHVEDDFGGHLFEIYSDPSKSLRLKCAVLDSCKWVSPSESKQLFKFNFNGQTDATTVKIDLLDFEQRRSGSVAVYDKDGSFYVNVGSLFDSPLGLVMADATKIKLSDGDGSLGFFKRDNTFCSISNENGVRCLEGSKAGIIAGSNAILVSLDNDNLDTPGYNYPAGGARFVPVVDHLVLNDDNYRWVSDGSGQCPAHHYVHQIRCVDQKLCNKVEVGCKRDSTDCLLDNAGTPTTHAMEHSVFVSCPDGSVVTAIDAPAKSFTCSPIHIDKDDHPGADSFPSFVNIGTVITPGEVAFDSINARNKKWSGAVPLKALATASSFVTPMVYGQKCFRENIETTAFKNPGSPLHSLSTPTDPGEAPKPCTNNNGFVSYIRCLKDKDCGAGLEFFCDNAPKCRYDGSDTVTVESSASATVPTCPFGTVITGISCINTDNHNQPCSKIKIACRSMVFDDSITPTPSPDKPDGPAQTKTIIIALATGIPLLIIAAIICLCCIPDNPDTPENRARSNANANTNASARVERISTPSEPTRSGLRKRHIF